jgi:Protein of unknown function (DUF2892)
MQPRSLVAFTLASLSLISVATADRSTIVVGRPRLAAVIAEPGTDPTGMAPMPEPSERSDRTTTIFGLPKNVGTGDRILRTVIGAGLAGAGIYGLTSGELSNTTSGVLLGVSAVPFATAATGYCPVYQLFGIDRSF